MQKILYFQTPRWRSRRPARGGRPEPGRNASRRWRRWNWHRLVPSSFLHFFRILFFYLKYRQTNAFSKGPSRLSARSDYPPKFGLIFSLEFITN